MLLFIENGTLTPSDVEIRFNTSHVTLYRKIFLESSVSSVLFQYISCYSLSLKTPRYRYYIYSFQYISCYSLSRIHRTIKLIANGFQYISCYSLSMEETQMKINTSCFNTSHVTLYPRKKQTARTRVLCFNTSHVTLYPLHYQCNFHIFSFQYISCYSLSEKYFRPKQEDDLFQYISCYSLSIRSVATPLTG